MKDDKGRDWAGNYEIQKRMSRVIFGLMEGLHPVDKAGVLGTLTVNFIGNVHAGPDAEVLDAFDIHCQDMRETLLMLLEQRKTAKN